MAVLTVKNAKKSFGENHVLNDISFEVGKGEVIAIIGPSGSGKSTLLRCCTILEHLDGGLIQYSGDVLCKDGKYGDKEQMQNIRKKFGLVFQNFNLFPHRTVLENIIEGPVIVKGEAKEDATARARELLAKVGLAGKETSYPRRLSGGQQQRTALARIMIYEPDMILLDEPFSALDSYLKEQTQRECLELLQDYPGTVILVSHSRDEIYRFSEEVLVMDGGKAVIQKTVKELFEHPQKVAAAKLTGCKNIEEIVWKDGKHLYVPGWDMVIPAGMGNVGDAQAIGIRAHEFTTERTESDGELVFPVYKPEVKEDLFEYHVQFFTSERAKTPVVWKVSKKLWDVGEKGVPKWLHLKREHILFLERE